MESSNDAIGMVTTETLSITDTYSADVRVNFAVPHLLAAALMCRNVGEIERTNAGQEFGGFWDDIMANASAALFLAVAALESYANELFVDHNIIFPEMRFEDMPAEFEKKPVLEKLEYALSLKSATTLNRGISPYQDVSKIIKLRNELVHFKPEWFGAQEAHAKLSKVLAHRATSSPFLSNTEPLFPRAWCSHATVKWIIQSVLALILKFEELAEIDGRMSSFKERFNSL